MSTTNATNFRSHLFEYLDNVVECNDTLKITTKKGNAIIISESDYNDIMSTLEITNNKEVLKDIKDGLNNLENPNYWTDESEVDFDSL